MAKYLLAIDQGTTSTRTILYDELGQSCGCQQIPLRQYFPQNGWVEHDPEEIWQATLATLRQVLSENKVNEVIGIGITNQRETTLVWHRTTGRPLYNAIVWQDRRTAAACELLREKEQCIQEKTGLVLDPYFSATKIAWILDNIPQARIFAEKGELLFGTVDTFLLWRLTGGKVHATDVTNASRTLLFNIHTGSWDSELLNIFNIPSSLLPQVMDNCADFGNTIPELLNCSLPIAAMAGDQQAALIGQACFESGSVKSTYGTGCFMLLNTGSQILRSKHHLLTTIAYRFKGHSAFALEGSIFAAGTIIQWLRDRMGLIKTAGESEKLAQSVQNNAGVYFVPAFTGLGAPYWEPHARGMILGLTRDTQVAHIVRAGLEAVAYQSYDLLQAMRDDGATVTELKVDGGMAGNNWLLQFLADMLNMPVLRGKTVETTALGVAYLVGLQKGVFSSLNQIRELQENNYQRFSPAVTASARESIYLGWKKALSTALLHPTH